MRKEMYVILDKVSGEFGEVLCCENLSDARRHFAYCCSSVGTCEDLELYYIGDIISNEKDISIQSADCSSVCSSKLMYSYSEVVEDVNKLKERNMENEAIRRAINITYSNSDFIDNVTKLARYFSKKDKKRF